MSKYIINCNGKTTFLTKSVGFCEGSPSIIQLPTTPVPIKNRDLFKFIFLQDIDDKTSTSTVKIYVNGEEFNLNDKYGNKVRVDQLRTNSQYYAIVSTRPLTFVITSNNLCRTSYNFPEIAPCFCRGTKEEKEVQKVK